MCLPNVGDYRVVLQQYKASNIRYAFHLSTKSLLYSMVNIKYSVFSRYEQTLSVFLKSSRNKTLTG